MLFNSALGIANGVTYSYSGDRSRRHAFLKGPHSRCGFSREPYVVKRFDVVIALRFKRMGADLRYKMSLARTFRTRHIFKAAHRIRTRG